MKLILKKSALWNKEQFVKGISAVALLMSLSTQAAPPTAPAGYKWEVVNSLTDEFNDTTVDNTKWYKYNPTWIGRAPGLFKESQVTESGGYLQLKNTKAAATTEDYWVHTGFLASKNQNVYAGMYSECQMKAAKDGTVSGFWFSNIGNDPRQEIDVQEAVGYAVNGGSYMETLMRMNTHYKVSGTAPDLAAGAEHQLATGVGDTFHTYGVWWKDKRNATMYYNGDVTSNLIFGGDYKTGMQLNLNTETQDWIGDPIVSRLNDDSLNTTYVNYIRTWRLVADTASAPIGSVISLKANSNGKYVSSDKNLDGTQWPLAANRTVVGAWEKFTVVDAGNGNIALKAQSTAKYVYGNGTIWSWPLISSSSTIGTWGTYQWISNSDGTISLKCIANSKYVCADIYADPVDAKLLTNRTSIGAWEKFTYTTH